MAKLAYAQGDFETALTYLQESLFIRQEVGDKAGEGVTLNDIGMICRVQGSATKALEYHEQAFTIWKKLGDRAGEAGTHWNIGLAYVEQGDPVKAEKYIALARAAYGDYQCPCLGSMPQEPGAGAGQAVKGVGAFCEPPRAVIVMYCRVRTCVSALCYSGGM
jgi:tetratricopeptide (TPR) repeat protein